MGSAGQREEIMSGRRLSFALFLFLFASPALGQAWTQVPHDPANFSGGGAMKWEVPKSAVVRYEMLDTSTMVVNFALQATTVGGKPDLVLQLKIPDGKRSAAVTMATMVYFDNWSGVDYSQQSIGIVSTIPGGEHLRLHKLNNSNWSLSDGKTYVWGQVLLEVGPAPNP
jgi:hypothetical protein